MNIFIYGDLEGLEEKGGHDLFRCTVSEFTEWTEKNNKQQNGGCAEEDSQCVPTAN
jgi:hypothetical protein